MPWIAVVWTDDNIAHLAQHDVSPEEAEAALTEPDEQTTSASSGRPIVAGYTPGGAIPRGRV